MQRVSSEKAALNRVLLTNANLVDMNWVQYPKTVAAVWRGIFDLTVQGKFRGTAFKDESFVGLESVPRASKALGSLETWEESRGENRR